MSIRTKIVSYLVLIHFLLAFAAILVFWDNRIWLLAVEGCFVLSILIGSKLVQAFFVPLSVIRTGAELISEGDFTSKFIEVDQPELNQLIKVYNQMIDQLRHERTLVQEQHYFMDKVLSASPSGIILFDVNNRVSLVNSKAEEILQITSEEIVGKDLTGFKNPFIQELNSLLENESKVLHLRGNRRLKCQASEFLDQGFPRKFIMMEELTEELRLSEKAAYEKLIRMMSHEVNNSFGAVVSLLHSCAHYGEQLNQEDRTDYQRAIEASISGAESLNNFMKRFAEVVRLPEPEKRPNDIQRLLEDIQTLLTPETSDRGISWQWDINSPLDPVDLDKNQMEQALVNIFKNSIEAIGREGRITIRLRKKNRTQIVIIEDTGPGISSEDQAQLFTPFFTTKKDGQGIGLTLVQEILVRHGFDFTLESRSGGPTRFIISLQNQ